MTVIPLNVAALDNAALAALLHDEATRRPVYNGDMARVMREAAARLKVCECGWRPSLRPIHATGGTSAESPIDICSHCHKPVTSLCPFEACPAGLEF